MKKTICFLICFIIFVISSCTTNKTLKTKAYDSNTNVSQGYRTGDYDEYSNYNIGCYRTYGSSGRIFTTILATPNYLGTEQPSCVYNLEAIKGIEKIEISYSTLANFYLLYSNDKSYSNRIDILSSNNNVVTLELEENASYFKICSTTKDVTLNYVTVYYNDKTKVSNSEDLNYYQNKINLDDLYHEYDNLEDGLTRQIPSNIVINDNKTYSVTEYKEYTYHTLSYLETHKEEANSLALTDPVDVSNYYMLFHTWPLNYFEKEDLSFGATYFTSEKLRRVSPYSRIDGYATSVPYKNEPNKDTPIYYELDFDASGYYSTTNRGTGRLVVWHYGFTSDSYDTNPVIVYTDDHYATFKEYLNYGVFGQNFNAEKHSTGYKFSASNILTMSL